MSELIEKLVDIKGKIERSFHVKKYDTTYRTLIDLARELQYLFPKSTNIRLSSEILDKYEIKSSDKSKNQVIEEFKDEMCFDLNTIINSLKRNEEINND